MKTRITALGAALFSTVAGAQDVRPAGLSRPAVDSRMPGVVGPSRLPNDLLNPAPNGSAEAGIKSFNPDRITVEFDNNRYIVRSGRDEIRDCGVDRTRAEAIASTIRDNGFTHRGEVPGGNPPFEYWLVETVDTQGPGQSFKTKLGAVKRDKLVSNLLVLPIDAKSIRVENSVGAWCVRDAGRVLYNFAQNRESAVRAAEILKKYDFNAVGIIGQPQSPAMSFPIRIPTIDLPNITIAANRSNPPGGLQLLADGLHLPEIGYVAHRHPIDFKKVELARGKTCALVAGGETLAQFGTDEMGARQMMNALQEWRITEYVEVGQPPFRFYLNNGQIARGTPFGTRGIGFRTEDLKLAKGKDAFTLRAGATPLFDCGTSPQDAELVLKVAKHFGVDALVKFGTPRYGEYPVLVKGR